jgi:3-oxoacyl-[acyl-carrier protein] reductase
LKSSIERLKGKRALVTGATGGMGQAIVATLLDAGVRVIASGRDNNKLAALKLEMPEIVTETADLSDARQTIDLANNSLKLFGGLDILINNAGIGFTNNVIELEQNDFEMMLNINLRAPFILSKIIGKAMAKSGNGYIINIGSGASYTPIAGMAGYCASKYGLLGFSESLALELREFGVKVSIITPGSTATRFGGGQPDNRLKSKPGILQPEDSADTVMYILGQSGRAWTSQVNLRPLNPNKSSNH